MCRICSITSWRLFLSGSGGAGEPGGGLPAAAEHALPHAVVVWASVAAAQRGRGVSAPADGRAGIGDGERRGRTWHGAPLGRLPAARRAPRTLPHEEEGRHTHVRPRLLQRVAHLERGRREDQVPLWPQVRGQREWFTSHYQMRVHDEWYQL